MRLKELRISKKLLQRDIADVLNCSTPVYCRYEKGEREPPFDIIKKLADYYGVTVDYLLGRDEIENTAQKKAPANGMSDEQMMAKLRAMSVNELHNVMAKILEITMEKRNE